MIRKKLSNFVSKLKDQIVFMILFAVAFVFLGQAIPEVYFEYLDKTVYYSMDLPLKVEKKEYKPGEIVRLSMVRNSKLEMTAVSVTELVLIDGKTKEEVARVTRDLSITKGTESICISFTLPENLKDGEYLYQGTINYKFQGLTKFFNFYSEHFVIKV